MYQPLVVFREKEESTLLGKEKLAINHTRMRGKHSSERRSFFRFHSHQNHHILFCGWRIEHQNQKPNTIMTYGPIIYASLIHRVWNNGEFIGYRQKAQFKDFRSNYIPRSTPELYQVLKNSRFLKYSFSLSISSPPKKHHSLLFVTRFLWSNDAEQMKNCITNEKKSPKELRLLLLSVHKTWLPRA